MVSKDQACRSLLRQAISRTGLALAILTGFSGALSAETLSAELSGGAVETVWTTCQTFPSVETDCTYTTVYAARGTTFQRFVTISLAILRVFPDGSVTVIDSATGYMQPATAVSIPRNTLGTAAVEGTVDLYGRCGDPNDLRTCYHLGVASLSARWRASGGTTEWPESRRVIDPSGIVYEIKTRGASRLGSATGSATYNDGSWPLGTQISGRILRFNRTETIRCPGGCPLATTAQSARSAAPAHPEEALGFDELPVPSGVRPH
jgi:hypothetical protein